MPDTPTVFVDVGAYRGWIDRAKRKAKRGTIARLAVAP
jgi:hypothetical protein